MHSKRNTESGAQTQPPRFFTLGLVALFAALLTISLAVGCESDAPLVDIDRAATQTAQAELGAPDTFTYRGVSFRGLESYQVTLTLSFSGVVGGVESRGTLRMDARIDTRSPAATSRVSVEGDAGVFGGEGGAFSQPGTFGKVYLNGVDYITGATAAGAETCRPQSVNLFDPLAYNVLLPDLFIPPEEVPPLTFVRAGPRVNESGPTWHFRAEGFSTTALETATLEILVTDEGAHVVQLALQGEGHLPGQAGAHGTVTLDYALSALNQPVEVTLPPACEPTPTPSLTPEPTPVVSTPSAGDT